MGWPITVSSDVSHSILCPVRWNLEVLQWVSRREFTFFLVIDDFSSKNQHVILKLHSHPQSLFLFLKTAIDVHLSGTRNISVLQTAHASNVSGGVMSNMSDQLEAYLERLSDFPKLLQHNEIHITDEMAEFYLEDNQNIWLYLAKITPSYSRMRQPIEYLSLLLLLPTKDMKTLVKIGGGHEAKSLVLSECTIT